MREAPKILWYDDQECAAGPVQFNPDEVKYVRADIVEEMRKIIQEELDWMDNGEEPVSNPTAYNRMKTALKRLEEE